MPEILVSVGVFVVVFIGIGALLVPLAILRGWVLSILWGWFMVPVFGLPALGIAQAIGVGLVVTTFTHTGSSNCQKSKDHKAWHDLIGAFAGPLIGLGIGYVVRRFIA